MAFYHSMLRICDYPDWKLDTEFIRAQKQAFASLAFGSAFMHGSHTSVGGRFDVDFIKLVAFTAHQASVSSFSGNSIILNDLSLTARSKTGAESQADIIQMSLD